MVFPSRKLLLSFLLLALIPAHSYLIQGVIDSNNHLYFIYLFLDKGFKTLDYYSTTVILNNGEHTGFVDNMGSFSMYIQSFQYS